MNANLTLLDNPAWWALCDTQHHLSVGNDLVKAYQHHILPFAAFSGLPNAIKLLEQWLPPEKPFFMIGDLPELPENWSVEEELPCLQMLWTPGRKADHPTRPGPETSSPSQHEPKIVHLEPKHKMIMYDLVQKVQPGYYEPDSYQLGTYFGIWEADQLVAMAGERIRLPGMSEVSAVCTHPAYRNRGYAARLTLEVCHYNAKEWRLPFLHVLETNQNAIRLYQQLGFQSRRIISFWKLSYH